jgi:hypothetical protein
VRAVVPEATVNPQTIAAAGEYWDQYYGSEFVFGMGTEYILAVLQRIPRMGTWADLGAGSESLLWSLALDANRLIAIDRDEQRLRILRAYARSREPRGSYRTVMARCGRGHADFTARCERVSAILAGDCLTGAALPLRPGSADLVTQFGLLGLTTSPGHFIRAWHACHEPLLPGGWAAGANWAAIRRTGRVRLNRQLYQDAFTRSGMTPLHIEQVPVSGDPHFDAVWIYLGRKR